MKTSPFAIFRRIYVVIFLLIALLGLMFTGITYMATTNFYETSTQLLNRDVAAHIAKFTSPYGREGFDRRKADSVFYEAMVISPSAEVYFLDTAGRVIYFHAHPGEVKSRQIPLDHILRYLRSKGMQHIDGPDPRDPGPKRLMEQRVYFEGSKRVSDKDFLVIPAEEVNAYLGGHWYLMTPKPVYFTHAEPRPKNQTFEEQDPTYGHVYHLGSAADVFTS